VNNSNNITETVDDTRPNAGRIYDYFLGGDHNFEVDRIAAEKLLEIYPVAPKILKLLRSFLGEVTRRLLREGYTQFLDFASALPVRNHIHNVAPAGVKVIYSDIDAATVAYAQEIIGNNSDVCYVLCDAAKPEDVLNSGIVEKMFDKNKKVAIGLSGVSYFLRDSELKHCLNTLYNWADEGYKIFISDQDVIDLETLKPVNDAFTKMGQPCYFRTQKTFKTLVGKWRVAEPGYQGLENWVDMTEIVSEEEYKIMGANWYGAFFKK